MSSPEPRLDRLAQRPVHERVPGGGAHPVPHGGGGRQRLQQRRRHGRGQAGGLAVEPAPGGVVGVGPGEVPERGRGGRARVPLDQQAEVAAVAVHRRERGHGPGRQRHPQPELGHDAVGQQADQVRVAGQPGVDAGEHPAADGGAAHVAGPFEDAHRQAGPAEVGRGHEGVVPPAHDHHVVAVAHGRIVAHGRQSAPPWTAGRPGGMLPA